MQHVLCFQLTSQHPYAEVFIGRPHVWTVDLSNREEVEDAVKAILNQKVAALLLFSLLPAFVRPVTWNLCRMLQSLAFSKQSLPPESDSDRSLAVASGLRISRRLCETQNSWWQMWVWVLWALLMGLLGSWVPGMKGVVCLILTHMI